MVPLKFSVATHAFGLRLPEMLETARTLGVSGLTFDARNELKPGELSDTGRRQFLHQLSDNGLAVAALDFPTRRAFYDQAELDARVAACRQVMDFAWQLRCRTVTVRVGRIPEEADAANRQILREVLNDLAAYGNRVGATLAITPMRDTSQMLKTLVDEVTAGPMSVNFDPTVFLLSGEAPEKAFRALHDRVGHITVRDALSDVDGIGVEVPVGRGEVPWDEMLALSQEAGFQGWMTVDRTQGNDRPGDIARAIAYLRTIAMGG